MATIQDLVNASHRIGQGAGELRARAAAAANDMQGHHGRLVAVVRGSRTGEDAARQVQEAIRAVQECAAKLSGLERQVDAFIQDVSK